jgi:sarcosine oxidase subunit beta
VVDRVVVVGAGVVGAATALELARQGAAVTLLEADGVAAGVSGGSLAALTRHMAGEPEELPFVMESTDRWAALAAQLRRDVGIDVEHEVSGQVALVEAEDAGPALAEVAAIVERERERGLEVTVVDRARVSQLVPALAGRRVVGGTWCPGDAKINALLACRALAHAAARHGAQIRLGERVEGFAAGEAGWSVRTPRGHLDADAVVVACGPWTAPLVAEHEPRLLDVLTPKRAQCCVTARLTPMIDPVVSTISLGISSGYTQLHQTRHGEILFNTVVETDDPRLADGTLDDRVDPEFMVMSARRLLELFPSLAGVRLLRAWGACEAWTPDRRFLIGPVGEREGLYVAAGDSGVGFLKAPMVARAVAAQVLGSDCGHDLVPYAPARMLDGAAA